MAFFEYRKQDAQGNEAGCSRIFYECSGSGPAVMLLHGWGCNHTFWAPIAQVLSRSYTVYNFDLPGFGQSDEPMAVWGVNEYVEMLEAFVREHCAEADARSEAGVGSRPEVETSVGRPGIGSEAGGALPAVSLVGHSFGGRMSILYASRNPVTRIALVDAAGVRPKRTLGYYRRVYTYKFKRWLVLNIFRRPDLFEQWRAHQGSADYKAASVRMKPIFSKVVNQDLKGFLPAIQAPVLLFWGEKDTATPLADAKIMEKMIPSETRLVVIPGAGHFAAFIEGKKQFADEMRAFFGIKDGAAAVAGEGVKDINKEGQSDGK